MLSPITHRLFGEDTLALMPKAFADESECQAYLLGNQGADPLLLRFSTRPQTAHVTHQFARMMRNCQDDTAIHCAQKAIRHLVREDQAIGKAFVVGLVAHDLLESRIAPFIQTQIDTIVETDKSLEGHKTQVEGIIRSDFDSLLLHELRHQTINEAPAASCFAFPERVSQTAGALLAQVAWETYGLDVGANAYTESLDDAALLYAVLDQSSPLASTVFGQAGRVFGGLANVRSLAHRTPTSLQHDASSECYLGLYREACDVWPSVLQSEGSLSNSRSYENSVSHQS